MVDEKIGGEGCTGGKAFELVAGAGFEEIIGAGFVCTGAGFKRIELT